LPPPIPTHGQVFPVSTDSVVLVDQSLRWISLGSDGSFWLEDQLNLLTHIGHWIQDKDGNMELNERWSIALIESTLRKGIVRGGDVLVAAPLGVSMAALSESFDLSDSEMIATVDRFLAQSDGAGGYNRFCLIPSSTRPASDLWVERFDQSKSGCTKLIRHNGGVYGLLQLPKASAEKRDLLNTTTATLSFSPPIVAFRGDERFDALCEQIWQSGGSTDADFDGLAESTTKILTRVGICGGYLLWERLDRPVYVQA
jgi:hypothetical protein